MSGSILEGIQGVVPSYCELCSEFQDIMLVETYPKGISIEVQNPINRSFGVTHAVSLLGKPPQNPMMPPMPSTGPHRTYQFGAYFVDGKTTKVTAAFNTTKDVSLLNIDHKWSRDLRSRFSTFVSVESSRVFALSCSSFTNLSGCVRPVLVALACFL